MTCHQWVNIPEKPFLLIICYSIAGEVFYEGLHIFFLTRSSVLSRYGRAVQLGRLYPHSQLVLYLCIFLLN